MDELLNRIFSIEFTGDQGCAVLAAITAAINENNSWIKHNEDSPARDEAEKLNKLLNDVGHNISTAMTGDRNEWKESTTL